MREILFRGKRKDSGEWVFGCYYKQSEFYNDEVDDHIIITSHEDLSFDQALEYCDVQAETVGQFTGLTDKNGTKIFEGDLISDGGMNGIPRVVRWIESSALFKCPLVRKHWAYDYNDVPLWSMQSEKTEVIGNIHDNPELLEGGAS